MPLRESGLPWKKERFNLAGLLLFAFYHRRVHLSRVLEKFAEIFPKSHQLTAKTRAFGTKSAFSAYKMTFLCKERKADEESARAFSVFFTQKSCILYNWLDALGKADTGILR